MIDTSGDGGAAELLSGRRVESEHRVADGDVEAAEAQAVGDAGRFGAIELESAESLQRWAEDKNAAAVLQGQEELRARGIEGEGVGTAIESGAGDELSGEREIEGGDGVRGRKGYVEQVLSGRDEERLGCGFDGNDLLDLPVDGGDGDDVVSSRVGDVDQVSGLIDGYATGRGHVLNVADDAPLLGIEEIDGTGAGMREENHSVREGNFIKARTAWKIEHGDLPERLSTGGSKQ